MNGRARERTLRPGLEAFSAAGRLFGGERIDRRALGQGLLHVVALALLAALTILAAVLAERRLAGALERPLSPWLLIVAGVLLAACAAVIRRVLFPRPNHASFSAFRMPLVFLPTLLMLVAGISLSLPGSRLWSLGCFWLLLVGQEVWSLLPWWPGRNKPSIPAQRLRVQQPLASGAALAEPPRGNSLDAEQAESDEDEPAETLPPLDVTQQMVRRRRADGTQVLSGSLRVEFAGGERTTTAHLAFCPPFDCTPEFSAAAMAGPGARVRAAQVLAYGVRLEIKLDAVSGERASVLVGFEATEKRDEG